MGRTWRRAARAAASADPGGPSPARTATSARTTPAARARRESTESPPRIQGQAEDVTDELERELREVRPRLARTILALLAGTIGLHAGLLVTARWTGLAPGEIGAVFNTTFTGLMTLAGTAIGFYFGDARGRRPRPRLGQDHE